MQQVPQENYPYFCFIKHPEGVHFQTIILSRIFFIEIRKNKHGLYGLVFIAFNLKVLL